METPLRESEAALGAVFGEVAGARLPRHYGDPPAEYHAAREAVGVADRSDLAHVRLWGKEPARMLHGLITNDLLGAPSGRGVYAAMLTPKGRMIAELRAFVLPRAGGTEVLVELPREALDGTTAHLKKFVPPMFARWANVSAEVGTIGCYGPRARELLTRVLGADVPALDEDAFLEASFGSERVLTAGSRYTGEPGFDLTAASTVLPALWDSLLAEGADLGVRSVGFGTLETLRIEAGRPRYGAELTEETIPTEAYESTGQMKRAISFTKGCYTGQEVIVRIAHRGHVNRHLRGLLLGDVPTPAPRTPLFHPESGKEVGWTTSAAASPLRAQTIALAYLRREVAPGDTVRLGAAEGAEGRVVEVPF
jgi:folate-binding protein YgfZ